MKLLQKKDSLTTEYKRDINTGILNTMCAFMNSYGGNIYVGYDDSGNIIGIKNITNSISKLNTFISTKFPSYVFNLITINNFISNNKHILIIDIIKSDILIHLGNKYYRRKGNRNESFNPKEQKLLEAGILPLVPINKPTNYYKIGNYAKGASFYRYMGLEAAILCLRNSSIRFVEPCTWADKFEGRFYNAIIHGEGSSEKNPVLFAYCVTNKKDNEAAWKIYSYNAVGLSARCVQFRLNRRKFREAILNAIENNYELFEGVIKYEDEQRLRTIHMPQVMVGNEIKENPTYSVFFNNFSLKKYLNLLLRKRNAFLHEQEVRFFLIPKNKNNLTKGLCKPVDLAINWSNVIEEVIIDSSCTELEEVLLTESITKFGNNGHAITSKDLLTSLKPKRCNIYGSEDDGKPIKIK